MSEGDFIPATTPFSRVFVIKNRARPDHEPVYEACLMSGGVEQAFGDITKIECPDPDSYNRFVEIGQIQGSIERASLPLTGRYAADLASVLLDLARRRCAADIHINIGECDDPSDPDTFRKKIIVEQVYGTNYSTEDLGTLASDGAAPVNETLDLSARDFYELLYLAVSERGQDVVVNPLIDVVFCSDRSCGECEDEDDGCDRVFALADTSPGSPGTGPDVVWSSDEGVNLGSDEITTMTPSESPSALACISSYVVVVANATDSLHYKLVATILAGTAGGWTEVTTGFVAAGSPNDIWSIGNFAFIVGDGGYVYTCSNPVAGVVVRDAGSATSQNLNAVHAISKKFAVAVGDTGAVVYTKDTATWTAATAPAAVTLTCVWIKSKTHWMVGASNGAIYYTVDEGVSWTQLTNLPLTLTAVNDIGFSTNSVGYLAGTQAGPSGVMLRTSNGGYSWVAMPEGPGNIPAADDYDALAACVNDENLVVAVGLADDAADGIFIRATD